MLKWLLKSLLILAVFVPFAAALPLASVSLCRTPDGAQFLFWTGPWSCCFWVLIYSQLSAAPWRQGARGCASVGARPRRSAGHIGEGDVLDVRRSVLLLLRRGCPSLPDLALRPAPACDLQPHRVLLALEARA